MNKENCALKLVDEIILLHCIVASNRIHDQPDDGLEKRSKHVVVPNIRYLNKAP